MNGKGFTTSTGHTAPTMEKRLTKPSEKSYNQVRRCSTSNRTLQELNADEAILPEVNNVLERLRLDFDLFEPLRKMLELDVNFFALRGMPENTECLYLHL